MPLPDKQTYQLKEVAERWSALTGATVTVEDLLQYAEEGKLVLSIFTRDLLAREVAPYSFVGFTEVEDDCPLTHGSLTIGPTNPDPPGEAFFVKLSGLVDLVEPPEVALVGEPIQAWFNSYFRDLRHGINDPSNDEFGIWFVRDRHGGLYETYVSYRDSCDTHVQVRRQRLRPGIDELYVKVEERDRFEQAYGLSIASHTPIADPTNSETKTRLMHLAENAAAQFWHDYDPQRPPKQDIIVDWLMREHGLSERQAKAIDMIIRPEEVRRGGNRRRT